MSTLRVRAEMHMQLTPTQVQCHFVSLLGRGRRAFLGVRNMCGGYVLRVCRWMSWVLGSLDMWKSFPMWFAGDRSMFRTCLYSFVCLSPGACMTRLCSYGMEVLGACHVASWQNAEVFLLVLDKKRCVHIEGEG